MPRTVPFGNDPKLPKASSKPEWSQTVTSLTPDVKKLKTLLNLLLNSAPPLSDDKALFGKIIERFGITFPEMKKWYSRKVEDLEANQPKGKKRKSKVNKEKKVYKFVDFQKPSDSTFLYALENKFFSTLVEAFWGKCPSPNEFYSIVTSKGYRVVDREVHAILSTRKRIVETYITYTNKRVTFLKKIPGCLAKTRVELAKIAPELLKVNLATILPVASIDIQKSFGPIYGDCPKMKTFIEKYVSSWTVQQEADFTKHKEKRGNTIHNFIPEHKGIVWMKNYFAQLNVIQQAIETNLRGIASLFDQYLLGPSDWRKRDVQGKASYVAHMNAESASLLRQIIGYTVKWSADLHIQMEDKKVLYTWVPLQLPRGVTLRQFVEAMKGNVGTRHDMLTRFIDRSFKHEKYLLDALHAFIHDNVGDKPTAFADLFNI